ncbi:MAG TPA: hypothetical protein VKU94_02250 [Geobacterales bacterium]|nr:hypothetical protein [Geobacterales bacterium]
MVTKKEKEYITKTISMLLRPEAAQVVALMLNKSEVGEEWLAKQSNLKVTVVRKILYDLFNLGLVDFKKERDEKSGWYIYNATFKVDQFDKVVIDKLKVILNKFKMRLKYEEENTFYYCPEHQRTMTETEALNNNYVCDVEGCGKVLIVKDKAHRIEKLKKKIDEIEKLIEMAESKP